MRIRCERCRTVFALELTPPPEGPIQVQCGRCGLVFTARPDAAPGPPPEPGERGEPGEPRETPKPGGSSA